MLNKCATSVLERPRDVRYGYLEVKVHAFLSSAVKGSEDQLHASAILTLCLG